MSNVRDFGAAGDGRADDTEAVRHALAEGDGRLEFPPGDYLLSGTVRVELGRGRRFGLCGGAGTAKIIMAAPGPAFQVVGTHERTALPEDFQPSLWQHERMPTVLNLEIEGRHAEADGFLLEGTMQATFAGVLLRTLRHGIHLRRRARNLLVCGCHVYNLRGVGVFLDGVNLHQAIISGSHISYCKGGGIKIVDSEIRNLQITGNDIEYNFDLEAPASADVWIDSSGAAATVREGTISGNTIQSNYSPGGANIRMSGQGRDVNHKAGMFTICGNLIGSQQTNVHLAACRGVVLTGNVLYSGIQRNLLVEGCRNLVLGQNGFDHNPDYGPRELCTGVRLADSQDITFSGTAIHDCQAGRHTVAGVEPIQRQGLLEIVGCRRVNVSGCQVLDGQPYGIYVADSELVSITGCQVLQTRRERNALAAIRWKGFGQGSSVAGNTLAAGREGHAAIDEGAGVRLGDNTVAG